MLKFQIKNTEKKMTDLNFGLTPSTSKNVPRITHMTGKYIGFMPVLLHYFLYSLYTNNINRLIKLFRLLLWGRKKTYTFSNQYAVTCELVTFSFGISFVFCES